MLDTIISLGGGTKISKSNVDRLCELILKTIESELPTEGHSHEAYSYVLDRCKEQLDGKKIVL